VQVLSAAATGRCGVLSASRSVSPNPTAQTETPAAGIVPTGGGFRLAVPSAAPFRRTLQWGHAPVRRRGKEPLGSVQCSTPDYLQWGHARRRRAGMDGADCLIAAAWTQPIRYQDQPRDHSPGGTVRPYHGPGPTARPAWPGMRRH
jgi:hypothetical protein